MYVYIYIIYTYLSTCPFICLSVNLICLTITWKYLKMFCHSFFSLSLSLFYLLVYLSTCLCVYAILRVCLNQSIYFIYLDVIFYSFVLFNSILFYAVLSVQFLILFYSILFHSILFVYRSMDLLMSLSIRLSIYLASLSLFIYFLAIWFSCLSTDGIWKPPGLESSNSNRYSTISAMQQGTQQIWVASWVVVKKISAVKCNKYYVPWPIDSKRSFYKLFCFPEAVLI